jgi:hypothetical protein
MSEEISSDVHDNPWEKVMDELRGTRKDLQELRHVAPTWAFPYQGRKILLRTEVARPIMQELMEIKQALSKISDQFVAREDRGWQWLDFIIEAAEPPPRRGKNRQRTDIRNTQKETETAKSDSDIMTVVGGCLITNCALFACVFLGLVYLHFQSMRKCA